MLDIQQNYLLCGQNQFGCSESIVQAGKVTLRNLRSKQTQQDFTSADGRLSYLLPYGPGAVQTYPSDIL